MNYLINDILISNPLKSGYVQKIKDKKMEKILKIICKIKYPLKKWYNSIIPLNIYQTWHTKKLPPIMQKNVDYIIQCNPAFNHHLFDDNDCREYIKNNFNMEVLNAYDSLIPGAYKADLWRYCILYKNGGIYLDIKYKPVNGFKFINLTEKEHWVLDMDKVGIYNALIICKPHNEILLKAIDKIVNNVKHKFYGNSPLEPTGPLMLSNFFTQSQKDTFDMYHDIYKSIMNRFIFYKNYLILKSYNEYLNEHEQNKKVPYYSILWHKRNIYK
jgi:mannosyltransferase OCH1-like enzyme